MPSTYIKRIAQMPIFDFMIPDDGFYVSTPGLSVTKEDKSYSALNNGRFYIMNKNNIPIYYNKLVVSRVQPRNATRTNNFSLSLHETTKDEFYIYDKYYIAYYKKNKQSRTQNGNIIGELLLRTSINTPNDSNILLLPFQSIEFAASYTVLNVNNTAWQYYGETNKRKGTIDIILDIYCFADRTFTTPIQDNVTISLNLINTGYVSASIQSPIITIPTI